MLKTSDLQIERLFNGAWQIYTLLDGYLETRLYYGYTKEEAIRNYLREFGSKAVVG
jgi:hypothetical protein